MITRATGLFSLYRASTTNSSGDTVDDNVNPLAVDIPLGLRNATRIEGDPNTATPRVIKYLRGTATVGTDLQAQDRIENQITGTFYVIDVVVEPLSSTGNSDLRFEAHRVN
jgi:hypothetical protein